MDYGSILTATAILAALGLLVGLFLGFAGKKFAVETDEREERVREALPGNNCGGCGYAGCDALAKAIVSGTAPVSACPVGGAAVSETIAAVMGVKAETVERKTAYVRCSGSCDKVTFRYEYYGQADCRALAVVPGGGERACTHGCLGYGSCVRACQFDAIHVVDGVAAVDMEKCTACGQCAKACPQNLIELVPVSAKYRVACSSTDRGAAVRAVCAQGCIGCRICEKQCESSAIRVEDNLAKIDYGKCTGCGKCAAKCPAKVIRMLPV